MIVLIGLKNKKPGCEPGLALYKKGE